MIWHMTEHKGKRGWHGPQPYRLTVSSRGYMTGTKLDSRPHPGLGTGTGEEKRARGCVLPWSTAGRLFRCLSDLPELPSHAGTAQWLHLSLCRHDSKEKLEKLTHCNAKALFMWRVGAHAPVDVFYMCLCLHVKPLHAALSSDFGLAEPTTDVTLLLLVLNKSNRRKPVWRLTNVFQYFD